MKKFTKYALAAGLLVGTGAACYTALKSILEIAARREMPFFARSFNEHSAQHVQESPYADQMRAAREWLDAQPLETVQITSHDGLQLTGHLLCTPNAKRIEIIHHGWRELWNTNHGMITQYLHTHETNVLLIEQRSHGASEGEYIGFGVLERHDCKRWAEYAAERFPALPIYLGGISMGATTVLMASGLELPPNVRGIIADSGFTSPQAILAHVLTRRTSLPEKPLLPLISAVSRLEAGYGLNDCSTIDVLRDAKLPVLFIHGDADTFVPLAMTLENYLACSAPKEILIVENARHGEGFLLDGPTYKAMLLAFFDRYDHA